MTFKTVYVADPVTRAYLHPYEAQESPMETGVFIRPTVSSEVAPPANIPDGQRAVLAADGLSWLLEDIPKPEVTPVPEPSRRDTILAELSDIDFAAIRPARAVALAVAQGQTLLPSNADFVKLRDLEYRAIDLRAELAALSSE